MDKAELQTKLTEVHYVFLDFISSLTDEQLHRSQPGKWNASVQMQHVFLCLRPIHLALSLPAFLPRLLFGFAKRQCRSYDALVADYQLKLQQGGKSPSIYVPDHEVGAIDWQARKLRKLVDQVSKKISRYTESELDEIRVPHPLLGKITLRELLYFAIYHVQHHHRQAESQVG